MHLNFIFKRSLILFFIIPAVGFSQGNFGLEISYLGGTSSIDVPGALKGQFAKVESGTVSFFSVGFSIQASEKISIRAGYKSWSIPFKPTVNGTYNNQQATATENGQISYSGGYLRVDRNIKYFFFTGGFDFSFSNSYKGDLVISNTSGSVLYKEDGKNNSILTNEFYNQFNLILGMGPSIPIGNFRIKGEVLLNVPFSSIYDSGVSIPQIYVSSGAPAPDAKVNLHYLPFLSYGVTLGYSFGK